MKLFVSYRKNIRLHVPKTALLVLLTALLALSGCGPFYGIFIEPFIPAKKVPAEHDIRGKTLLIWVDHYVNTEHNPILRREITAQLTRELKDNQAVGQVIDYQRLVRFRHENPDLANLSVQQLGQKLQADEVLYVLIDQFKLKHEAGEGYYHARAGGYVKVVDVANGNRLWPTDQVHWPFHVDKQVTTGSGQEFANEQVRNLCRDLAHKIAPFFYEHKKSRN